MLWNTIYTPTQEYSNKPQTYLRPFDSSVVTNSQGRSKPETRPRTDKSPYASKGIFHCELFPWGGFIGRRWFLKPHYCFSKFLGLICPKPLCHLWNIVYKKGQNYSFSYIHYPYTMTFAAVPTKTRNLFLHVLNMGSDLWLALNNRMQQK